MGGLSWANAGPARKATITAAATTLMRVLPDPVFRISAQRPRRDTTTVRLHRLREFGATAFALRVPGWLAEPELEGRRREVRTPGLSLQTIGRTPSASTFKHLHDTLI